MSKIITTDLQSFIINDLAKEIHADNVRKGFYDPDMDCSIMTKLALVHSEVSEAVEAYRKGNIPDDHCPEHASTATELADVIIRVLDLANYMGYEIGDVIQAKLAFNRTRPYKHAKEF